MARLPRAIGRRRRSWRSNLRLAGFQKAFQFGECREILRAACDTFGTDQGGQVEGCDFAPKRVDGNRVGFYLVPITTKSTLASQSIWTALSKLH
jgi:hypothetical protein